MLYRGYIVGIHQEYTESMNQWEEKPSRAWEVGCYILVAGIALVFFAAWLHECAEAVGGLMFGFFVIWQVVRGLIIKRYYWHIAEEKVSFWGVLAGFLVSLLCYWLCQGGAK